MSPQHSFKRSMTQGSSEGRWVYSLPWSWSCVHGYMRMSKLILYTFDMSSLLYVSCTSIKLLRKTQ